MKRNRSLLTADIMQVRLDAEIKVAERVTKCAHATERQPSEPNEKQLEPRGWRA